MSMIIPRLCLVAARGRNGVIGRKGDLPWRLAGDLARFKALTLGKPIIMGRKTWESLPRRPLPGRLNIVITGQAGYRAEGAQVVGDFGEALDAAFIQADLDQAEEVCVIGGAQVYATALVRADRLYLTDVETAVEGDAHFPEFDAKQWHEVCRESAPAGPKDEHACVFRVLDRA